MYIWRSSRSGGQVLHFLYVLLLTLLSPQTHSPNWSQINSRNKFILAAGALVASANSGAFTPAAAMPSGSSCMLDSRPLITTDREEQEQTLAKHIKLIDTSNRAGIWAQQRQPNNSVQIIKSGTRSQQQLQQQPNDQPIFDSVCNEWRNDIKPDLKRPLAYWVLDRRRGALVAKFNYYGVIDLNMRQARLSSPLFRPIPAYHSSPANNTYYESCKISFRSYLTIHAQLDLTLITVPTSLSSQTIEPLAPDQQFQSASRIQTLKEITKPNRVTENKHKYQQQEEFALWEDHTVTLPTNLDKNTLYKLEFSANYLRPKSEAATDVGYLKGAAISNFTLSPQCFGLQVDPEIVRRETGADLIDPATANKLVEEYKLNSNNNLSRSSRFSQQFSFLGHPLASWLVLVLIIVLIIFTGSTQYLLCLYTKQRRRTHLRQSGPTLWQYICCCWCCYLTSGDAGIKLKNGGPLRDAKRRHHRVYVSSGSNDLKNHLRPLSGMFENVELIENPHYQSNGPTTARNESNVSSGLIGANGCRARSVTPTSRLPLEPYQIDRKRLTLTGELGKGAFGEVFQGYLVCYCSTDSTSDSKQAQATSAAEQEEGLETLSIKVAVKTLTKERMSQDDFIREATSMSQVSHRNIVEFIGVCFEKSPFYIIMELLQGGNLKKFLTNNRDFQPSRSASQNWFQSNSKSTSPLPVEVVLPLPSQMQQMAFCQSTPRVKLTMGDLLVLALDIARACDYLQSRQFIHRDLAARNCLLTQAERGSPASDLVVPLAGETKNEHQPPSAFEVDAHHKVNLDEVYLNGYQDSGIVAKLADFGMTRDIYTNDYYRMEQNKELPVRWTSPECLDGVATTKSDVWSFGVLLWELFSMGKQPYGELSNHQVKELIKARRHPKRLREQLSRDLASGANRATDPELLLAISGDEQPRELRGDDDGPLIETDEESEEMPPPLPPPCENTPHPIYSIMCSCWATEPEDRPRFEEIANRLYWCLRMPEVLNTSLPLFRDSQAPHYSSQHQATSASQQMSASKSQPYNRAAGGRQTSPAGDEAAYANRQPSEQNQRQQPRSSQQTYRNISQGTQMTQLNWYQS